MTADEYRDELRKGVCTIEFVKKDGTNRVMHGTLKMDVIPEEKHPKSDTNSTQDDPHRDEIVRVFDTDKEAWRSFRIDSVVSFQPAQ